MFHQFSERYTGYALVTGASSGIGAAFARQLAAFRIPLILIARRLPALETLAQELRDNHHIDVRCWAFDLCEPQNINVISERLNEESLIVSLLVNNAGVGSNGDAFIDSELDHLSMITDLHCRVPMELTHRLLPMLSRQTVSGIVFTSSIAAYQPTPGFAVYGCSKAYTLSLAESLWAELREHGVDVIAVSPGPTHTEFFTNSGRLHTPAGAMEASQVAREALAALGKKPSHVPGLKNRVMSSMYRLLPRRMIINSAHKMALKHHTDHDTTTR